MGTPVVYNQFKLKQHNGNAINLATGAIKVMIVSSAYTPSLAHAFQADLSGEVSGSGYTSGGTAIAGVTLTLDGNVVEWVHNDITWSQNAGGFSNGRTFIWYEDTGNTGTSKLIMYMQEGADFGNVVGDLLLDSSQTAGVLNVS